MCLRGRAGESRREEGGSGTSVTRISQRSTLPTSPTVGAMASKPVMEGKAVLFKHFGGVDAFDIEVGLRGDLGRFVSLLGSLLIDPLHTQFFVLSLSLSRVRRIPRHSAFSHISIPTLVSKPLNRPDDRRTTVRDFSFCLSIHLAQHSFLSLLPHSPRLFVFRSMNLIRTNLSRRLPALQVPLAVSTSKILKVRPS
jgi:hypothetical protein